LARRIFVSFAYDDLQQAKGFNLLRWNPHVDFDFVGRHLMSPVDSENPDYIKSKIREEMKGASCTVVLVGERTAESEWVDFEIRETLAQGKPVLGIRLKGAETAKVPPALIEANAKVLDWSPHEFEDAIERAVLVSNRPQLAPPTRWSSGSTCGH